VPTEKAQNWVIDNAQGQPAVDDALFHFSGAALEGAEP